jgi:hypothetical protein
MAKRKVNLERRRIQKTPVVRKMSRYQIYAKINDILRPNKYDGPIGSGPMLSARTPWIDCAYVDVYRPGRWDTTSDTVFFEGITTGSSPGQWDGSVAYVEFTPPSTGKYLILTHFSGYKTQCDVNGPWGTASATTNATTDDGLVVTLYNATNTNKMGYTFSFKGSTSGGGIMGYWYGTEFIKM